MSDKLNICVIGTGYVGLPTGACLADLGHRVVCVDNDAEKINLLQKNQLPFFEEELSDVVHKNVQAGRLSFSDSIRAGAQSADLVIITVGTPIHHITQAADLSAVFDVIHTLAPILSEHTVVAVKSTVPVGTGDKIEAMIRAVNPAAAHNVISLPEFLREGFVVHDFLHPDRIVIGTDNLVALQMIHGIYASFPQQPPMIYVCRRSAEAIKYASNAFLAVKIHYMNEMADLCEQYGADITEVARGMGADSRIGSQFLNAGPGFGGSCFPKDALAVMAMAHHKNVNMSLINATIQGNEKRKQHIADRILTVVQGINNPRIAVLGLAFKAGTDNCRQSPAVDIILNLVTHAADVTVYDPQAMQTAHDILGHRVRYADDMYQALTDADVVVVLTEWPVFKELDLTRAGDLMRHKIILDCRNLLTPQHVTQAGFVYHGIGR